MAEMNENSTGQVSPGRDEHSECPENTATEPVLEPVGETDNTQNGQTSEIDRCDGEPHLDGTELGRGARSKQSTTRGRDFWRDTKYSNLKRTISRWRRIASLVETLLVSSNDIQEIELARDDLARLMRDMECESEELLVLYPDSDCPINIEDLEADHYDLNKRIGRKLQELNEDTKSTRTHSSRASSCGSRKSGNSVKQELAAKAAELEVELEYMQAGLDSHIEATRSELKQYMTQKELAKAKARLRAISEADNFANFSTVLTRLPVETSRAAEFVQNVQRSRETVPDRIPTRQVRRVNVENARLNPTAETFVPNRKHDEPSTGDSVLQKTMANLVDHLSASRLPPPEPGIFTGDVLQYASWKCAFETLIENRRIDPTERIYYLKKYLGGKARECVEGYFLMNTEGAYFEAKRKLEARYGDSFILGRAFMDKLERWPRVSPRDGVGLRGFADFLAQCETAMTEIESLNSLNDSRELQKLQQKLPDWLGNRWARLVWEHKRSYEQFPPFSVFVAFVTKEADIMCDPATTTSHVKVATVEKTAKQKTTLGPSSHQVLASSTHFGNSPSGEADGHELSSSKTDKGKKLPCALCKADHHLKKCPEFLKKSLDEKWKLVKELRLCFSCLAPKHAIKNCKNKTRCQKCHRFHASILHIDETSKKTEPSQKESSSSEQRLGSANTLATNLTGGISDNYKTSMIVPVYVSKGEDSRDETLVYALQSRRLAVRHDISVRRCM